MKRVLLTGATGFIGKQTIPYLLSLGYEVHAVYNHNMITENSSAVIWHRANLLDFEVQRRLLAEVAPTHLLHLAWYTQPQLYWNSIENTTWVQASIELVKNFVGHGGIRAVFGGSCAEYDWHYSLCSEKSTPLNPNTLYGTCKDSLQKIVTYMAEDMQFSFAWGRIFFVYGPGEYPQRLVPSVINALLCGKQAQCSHGKQIRDFLYVKDVANAFVTLLASQVLGPINIASGKPVSIQEIVSNIAYKLALPENVQFGAIPLDFTEPIAILGDITRISYELGWEPQYMLDAGLQETIEWWKRKSLLGGYKNNEMSHM
ncbi:Hypothetical protein LUCI_0732 [Lucifera butyrica]|uniref:NAD-dependent epimerase/dehydratase domain-containing protein n=1 Tax=Lucifera butyrica TaxID=1351585 RepID=A0A498R5J6_9FIRM|nr:NAD(P)-dependent oxidoreductase [Lucifera butyrica]VBB05522.1 Hypothetical protein LUCI_0732 [Lucifera butyrica]